MEDMELVAEVDAGTRPGYYGKLPQRGDFIKQGLSEGFVRFWDEWMSRGINHIRESMGEKWLSHYLHTPVWRYYVSSNIIDDNSHTGIWFPSVDKVGRYFPFTIDHTVANVESGLLSSPLSQNFFAQLEKIGLITLDEACEIEDMEEALAYTSWPKQHTPVLLDTRTKLFHWTGNKQEQSAALADLLLTKAEKTGEKFSIWWCDLDSDSARLLFCPGMPNQQDFLHFVNATAEMRQ